MKIIKIQFGSPKVYTYLLDFKVKDPPKKGDVLKHIAGATAKGAYYDKVTVVDVQVVDKLPAIVTSVVKLFKFKDGTQGCNFDKLSESTILKLKDPKDRSSPSSTSTVPINKRVCSAVSEYLRLGNKAWKAKYNIK